MKFRGPGGIRLVLDTSNPDTPAMVYSACNTASATYDCACGEHELWSRDGAMALTSAQVDWLAQFVDAVCDAYDEARKGMKEYQ